MISCVGVRAACGLYKCMRAVAVKSALIYVIHKWHLFIDFPDTVPLSEP